MGGASSRLKQSKNKHKIKQFMSLLAKGATLPSQSNPFERQNGSDWIENNIPPNFKIHIRKCKCETLSKEQVEGKSQFISFVQNFQFKGNYFEFKDSSDLLDVEYTQGKHFEIIKFKCRLNGKFNMVGQMWFTCSNGKFYQFSVEDEEEGFWDRVQRGAQQSRKLAESVKGLPSHPPSIRRAYQSSSASNAYDEKPTDWNGYYNAQVQQSNAQFRENMNRQAQDWNNYAAQKANRGW